MFDQMSRRAFEASRSNLLESVVREPYRRRIIESLPGIFAFPRGTQAGTCLHKVFEELDFTRTSEDSPLEKFVAAKLSEHGIDVKLFTPAVVETVRRAVAVPLATSGFTLAQVSMSARLNEQRAA